MIIEYTRQHKGVTAPTRSNPSDAGLDVYAYLKVDGDAGLSREITILPGCNVMVPTGLRFGIPHGYMLQVCNRSSMGAKKSLIVGAHIIDSGYDGEVFIDLHNVGSDARAIQDGDKIAQVIMIPVVPFRAKENKAGTLYSRDPITISARGAGALGSTGQ